MFEARGHDEHGVDDLSHSLVLAVGARHQVAEALRPRVEESDESRQTPEGGEDLEEAGEGADEGVPKPDRSAIVAHNASANRELSERSPVRHRLDDRRNDDREGHQQHDRQGLLRRRVDGRTYRGAADERDKANTDEGGGDEVDDGPGGTQNETRRSQVEGDRLTRDQFVIGFVGLVLGERGGLGASALTVCDVRRSHA